MQNIVITTVLSLDPAQQKKLISALDNSFKQKANYNFKIDKDLVGGLKITDVSFEYDGSIQGKLKKLATQLMNNI